MHARVPVLLGAAQVIRETIGSRGYGYYRPDPAATEGAAREAQRHLGEDRYDDALDLGRRLSPDEATDVALAQRRRSGLIRGAERHSYTSRTPGSVRGGACRGQRGFRRRRDRVVSFGHGSRRDDARHHSPDKDPRCRTNADSRAPPGRFTLERRPGPADHGSRRPRRQGPRNVSRRRQPGPVAVRRRGRLRGPRGSVGPRRSTTSTRGSP